MSPEAKIAGDWGQGRPASPRVLAAVIVPPHLSVSGGARAAEQLSAALAPYCDMTIASMMNGSGAGVDSAEAPRRIAVTSWCSPWLRWSSLPSRYRTLFYRSNLPELVARGGYDLVHLHNPMPALELERTAAACRRTGTPYVISTHGFNEVANGSRIYGFNRLKRAIWQALVVGPVARVVRHAAGVFALSPADIEIVTAMGFKGPISIVTNGVPVPPLSTVNDDQPLLRRLGLPEARAPGRITCMFLANHTPNKGLPQLLEAFSRLRQPYLLVVGGEKRDGIDYDRYASACGPDQRIIVTGRLSDAEVAALFRRSDLFVFPTLADTLPLVVLEAMAHGLPVLATRVGGIPFQVDETCGVLVPPGDVAAIAEAVASLAADPARLAALGVNARARVLARFTWERAAEQALAGYEKALRAPVERRSLAGQSKMLADAR
ncbi:glycosyltransferase involved in cell wall biosynthesis [Humitalea rosea]|uniref:Glycosyltransferase involved in cell wall biosynthesis n=1 Tax=Humitalea rosea TaxID=990373 RepID=A0A2W7HVL4_9PROT|nr:glycosyltransferase family 4 protein [Humitalea rosea]PZW38686.1 glycosyltransferase involved in cell wall biosynthesis [Humitalea rosea]